MKFISLQAGCEISGHKSPNALDQFVRRHNRAHPEALILRRRGCVEKTSLEAALLIDAAAHTPGFRNAEAIRRMALEA